MSGSVRLRWTCMVAGLAVALAAASATGPPALAHPDERHDSGWSHPENTTGVQINYPSTLGEFVPAWSYLDLPEVDGETAELVYAGTGCTPLHWAQVDVKGKIALVDHSYHPDSPTGLGECTTFSGPGTSDNPDGRRMHRAVLAEQAGAIGLIVIASPPGPGNDHDPTRHRALPAGIPALNVTYASMAAVRDQVRAGTRVSVTLTDTEAMEAMTDVRCVDGKAGPFSCKRLDLLAYMPRLDFGGDGSRVSDVWGWTDSTSGREYVILGKNNGIAFVDVTVPTDPRYLGDLPNRAAKPEVWQSVKVYKDHVFVVSESLPHGMTVFDLTRLTRVTDGGLPQKFTPDAVYPLSVSAHSIAINESTGFAYIVGGNVEYAQNEQLPAGQRTGHRFVYDQCRAGLHFVDIRNPKVPTFAGCYDQEGGPGPAELDAQAPRSAYVHDTECVTYRGPDEQYKGREVCFNAAVDAVDIVDVTDKLRPKTLGSATYTGIQYAHQGALTADQRYLLVNDELDEYYTGVTRTIVLDISDLDAPREHFVHVHKTDAIDHNNYVHDGFVYQSNYTAGLRVLDLADVAAKRLKEVAFFDTTPGPEWGMLQGTWSNYPFFKSGTIAVSSQREGLFLLRRRP